jgi:hypothetical protein
LPFLGAVVTLLWIERTRSHVNTLVRTIIASVLILATAISVPLAFYLNGLRSGAHIAWDFSRLLDFTIYQTALSQLNAPATHVALWATWAAFVNFLFPFVLIACTFVACIRDHERRSSWIALLFLAGGMAVSGFILRTTGEFTFLVDYERGNYADRLFLISELLLLAPALAGATLLAKRIVQRPATNIAAFLIFLVGWTSAQAYLALPRHDATIVGHGWSVGQADFEAVRWIDRDAAGKTYTVLADQSVSAAAVESFGFKRYVGDVFYYPIPTGGSLYEVYLRAVGSEPTRDIIKEAATLGNSALVYVVLNDYWWDATNVAENLKAIADRTYEIQNGKDTIYRFDFKSDKKR